MAQRLMQYDEWQRHSYYNRPGFRTREQILGDGVESKAARQRVVDANLEYEQRVTNAYRQDNIFEENTDRLSRMPGENGAGSPARNFGQQKEGDLCTTDDTKAPGRLRRDPSSGQLVCVADYSTGRDDSRSLADKMEAHSLRMQEEYEDYCRRQSDAWKTLR
jgi:hypothetical protein